MDRYNILYIDDEEGLLDAGSRMLKRLGHQVAAASNATEALELFSSDTESYDLVITDISLPDMTGIELAREIIKIRPNTPVIACSGHEPSSIHEESSSAGIRAYIKKPYSKQEVADKINRVLDV